MDSGKRHPIEGLMQSAMESIKEIVDVNTILGDPVETPDGSVILPISRVSLGFAAGGTEFEAQRSSSNGNGSAFPFGGGSGAGISVNPVAFLVVGQGQIRLMPVDASAVADRLIDMAPKMFDRLQGMFEQRSRNQRFETHLTDPKS